MQLIPFSNKRIILPRSVERTHKTLEIWRMAEVKLFKIFHSKQICPKNLALRLSRSYTMYTFATDGNYILLYILLILPTFVNEWCKPIHLSLKSLST